MRKIALYCILFVATGMPLHAQLIIDTSARLETNPGIFSLLVSQHDHIVYERYFKKYDSNTLFSDQSLTKSICSILIGIAIDKGYLTSVDEKLVEIFPELKNDSDTRKLGITVRQVMNQASGLYHEDLKSMSGVADFLHLPDQSGYVLKAPLVTEPGKEWHYSNAASHLLSVIITKTTHVDTRAFAMKWLFGPLHITEIEWAKMNDGYYDGSGLKSIRMRSNDLLKIGSLLLHGGTFEQKHIVSEKWVNLIFNPDVTYHSYWGFENSTYAICFYHTTYHGTDITYGMGWGGQFLIMIPSVQTLIVANENIADENAVRQSIAFTDRIFPAIFNQLKKDK